MSGLTNKYLEELSKIYIKKNFLGVYPSDAIPNINKKKEFSIIFNLSKHFEPGSHFISIVKFPKQIIYFDSFGKNCKVKSIKTFINKFKLPIKYNKKQIQHHVSNFCGYFCFYFLYHCFEMRKSLSSFLRKFPSKKLKQNDNLLLTFILDLINKH